MQEKVVPLCRKRERMSIWRSQQLQSWLVKLVLYMHREKVRENEKIREKEPSSTFRSPLPIDKKASLPPAAPSSAL